MCTYILRTICTYEFMYVGIYIHTYIHYTSLSPGGASYMCPLVFKILILVRNFS